MAEYRDYELEFIEESKIKYREALAGYGLSEEQLEQVCESSVVAGKFYDLDLERKLAILYAVGYPLENLKRNPNFLYTKLEKLMLRCEFGLVEQVPINGNFLSHLKCREAIVNYGARERGFLPEDWNIFCDSGKSAAFMGVSKRKFVDRFYSHKSFKKLHEQFKQDCPQFYELFSEIPEYQKMFEDNEKFVAVVETSTSATSEPKDRGLETNYDSVCYSTDRRDLASLRKR